MPDPDLPPDAVVGAYPRQRVAGSVTLEPPAPADRPALDAAGGFRAFIEAKMYADAPGRSTTPVHVEWARATGIPLFPGSRLVWVVTSTGYPELPMTPPLALGDPIPPQPPPELQGSERGREHRCDPVRDAALRRTAA